MEHLKTINVNNCARCAGNHNNLRCEPLSHPTTHTHYAICPVTEEPILVCDEGLGMTYADRLIHELISDVQPGYLEEQPGSISMSTGKNFIRILNDDVAGTTVEIRMIKAEW